MGVRRGNWVHYRNNGDCDPAMIVLDDETNYMHAETLEVHRVVAGLPVVSVVTDKDRPEEGPFNVDGEWHDISECPDA